jgi:hypothetical protein
MEFDFYPLHDDLLESIHNLASTIRSKIVFHTKDQFPDLDKVNIAIVGVLENRGYDKSAAVDLTAIRKELYAMFPGNWVASIADLGDIAAGNSIDDSYFAVKKSSC